MDVTVGYISAPRRRYMPLGCYGGHTSQPSFSGSPSFHYDLHTSCAEDIMMEGCIPLDCSGGIHHSRHILGSVWAPLSNIAYYQGDSTISDSFYTQSDIMMCIFGEANRDPHSLFLLPLWLLSPPLFSKSHVRDSYSKSHTQTPTLTYSMKV